MLARHFPAAPLTVVLVDTLLVRAFQVPALAVLLGERFWWPSRRTAFGGRERSGGNLGGEPRV